MAKGNTFIEDDQPGSLNYDSVKDKSRENPQLTYVLTDNVGKKFPDGNGHLGVLAFRMTPNEMFHQGWFKKWPPVSVFHKGLEVKIA